jgi:hypothetical protein
LGAFQNAYLLATMAGGGSCQGSGGNVPLLFISMGAMRSPLLTTPAEGVAKEATANRIAAAANDIGLLSVFIMDILLKFRVF